MREDRTLEIPATQAGDHTLDYYNENAKAFAAGTVAVDFTETQDKFLDKIRENLMIRQDTMVPEDAMMPETTLILDFGCGAGRDTKYFLEKGFQVEATDGSAELCRIASEYTGIPVKKMLFSELNETAKYDGIWACSSILHLPKDELKPVIRKMAAACKEKGIIYTSFKYGEFEGDRNGRYFTDFTEETFVKFMKDIPELTIIEIWITGDIRPGREAEKWLNILCQ